MKEYFRKLSSTVAQVVGSPLGFAAAIFIVLTWAVTGPIFGWSSTWQLIINTFTNIIVFLMVFLIQHTQNRDSKAIHLKLDELLQKNGKDSKGLVNVEDVSDDQLETMHQHYKTLHEKYETELKRRKYVA